ncbi:MAG TPA: type II secretion system protein [Patescibacteria group bacterium]
MLYKKFYKSKSGFTLIELIVSIGVLAILAVFAIAAVNPIDQFKKARDSQRKSDLAQLQRVLEQYYQDWGHYPPNDSSYHIEDEKTSPATVVSWGGALGWSPYMDLVPNDPLSSRTYRYYSTNSGQTYYLFTSLERGPLDPSTCKATDVQCKANPSSTSCNCTNASTITISTYCGTTALEPCNYGVSSSNTTP